MPLFIFIPAFAAPPPDGALFFTPLYPFDNENYIPKSNEIIFGIRATGTQQLNRSSLNIKINDIDAVIAGIAVPGYSLSFEPGGYAPFTGEIFTLHPPFIFNILSNIVINVSFQSYFPQAFDVIYSFTTGDFPVSHAHFSSITPALPIHTHSMNGSSLHSDNYIINKPQTGLFVYGKAKIDRYDFPHGFRKEIPQLGNYKKIGFDIFKVSSIFRREVFGNYSRRPHDIFSGLEIDNAVKTTSALIPHAHFVYDGMHTDAIFSIADKFTAHDRSIDYGGLDTGFDGVNKGASLSQQDAIMEQTNSGAAHTFPTIFGPKFGAKVLDAQNGAIKIQKRIEDA